MTNLAKENIFPIEITAGQNNGKWIVYMPLVGYAKLVEREVIEELIQVKTAGKEAFSPQVKEILAQQEAPEKPFYHTSYDESGLLNLMILPNNICNFRCSYCYSAKGRSNLEIDPEILKMGLDYFFNKTRAEGKRLTISVLGGGEPLLSWNILKPALEYAYQLNAQRGGDIELPVSLVTNGSIITDEIISFCRSKRIDVSVSFDILEDIQNAQRGSYDLVKKNIVKLSENGIDVALNTVITDANVMRMEEMIETLHETLPNVKKVAFKPLISGEYFEKEGQRAAYYRNFADCYFKARELAGKYGIYLICSYHQAVACLSDRFCPGKFVITAEGELSICHCVPSEKDDLSEKFIFGTITKRNGIAIASAKLKEMLRYDISRGYGCELCPAKWHCAGGCYADNVHMKRGEHSDYCHSMRYFLMLYLQQKYGF